MGGFGGNSFSYFKNKITLAVFAILAGLYVAPRFVSLPSFVSLLTLPIDLVNTMTLGMVLSGLPSPANLIGPIVISYVFAVVIGFFVHTVGGGSNDFSM